jgi:membrane protein required for colicin V production
VEYAKALSYLVLFFGVLLGVFFISLLLRGILKLIMLGWLDILGGGVLGALKGTLIACILVLALTAFLPAKAPILTQSKFVPYITRLNNELAGMLPDDMKMQFEEKSRSLDEYWRNTWKHPRKNAENQ